MSAARAPRWVVSFADLCMLLLGFFVILHARADDPRAVADGMRRAFGSPGAGAGAARLFHAEYRADALFQPGEAVFRPGQAALLARVARAAGAGILRVESHGADPDARRFDAWELAAARTAAVARALRAAGVPESRIEIAVPPLRGGGATGPQTLSVTAH